jgi:hypothetical protein
MTFHAKRHQNASQLSATSCHSWNTGGRCHHLCPSGAILKWRNRVYWLQSLIYQNIVRLTSDFYFSNTSMWTMVVIRERWPTSGASVSTVWGVTRKCNAWDMWDTLSGLRRTRRVTSRFNASEPRNLKVTISYFIWNKQNIHVQGVHVRILETRFTIAISFFEAGPQEPYRDNFHQWDHLPRWFSAFWTQNISVKNSRLVFYKYRYHSLLPLYGLQQQPEKKHFKDL